MKNERELGRRVLIGFTIISLAILFGCGKSEDEKITKLSGVWSIESIEAGGHKELTKMRLEKSKFTLDKECSFRGISTVATASSEADITDKQITVKEAKSDAKTVNYEGGRLICEISFPAGTIEYELKDGKLHMKDPISSEPREYTKLSDL